MLAHEMSSSHDTNGHGQFSPVSESNCQHLCIYSIVLASLLTEVCSDVAVEPALQPITGRLFGKDPHPLTMELVWTFEREVSGEVGQRVHLLTSGFSIQTHPPTTPYLVLPNIAAVRKQRGTCTRSGSGRWSTPHSLHWSSQHQVERVHSPAPS